MYITLNSKGVTIVNKPEVLSNNHKYNMYKLHKYTKMAFDLGFEVSVGTYINNKHKLYKFKKYNQVKRFLKTFYKFCRIKNGNREVLDSIYFEDMRPKDHETFSDFVFLNQIDDPPPFDVLYEYRIIFDYYS